MSDNSNRFQRKENVKPCREELLQYIAGLSVVVSVMSFPAQKSKYKAKLFSALDESIHILR